MENLTVELAPRAVRELDALPSALQLRIIKKIQTLSSDPTPRGTAIKRLHGFPQPTFRLRIGDYRVVFLLEKDKIVVLRIIHRRELERALATLLPKLKP